MLRSPVNRSLVQRSTALSPCTISRYSRLPMRSRFQYSASACARRWYSGSSDRTRGNGAPSESVVAESTARECIEVPAPRATSSDGGLVDVPGRRLVGAEGETLLVRPIFALHHVRQRLPAL